MRKLHGAEKRKATELREELKRKKAGDKRKGEDGQGAPRCQGSAGGAPQVRQRQEQKRPQCRGDEEKEVGSIDGGDVVIGTRRRLTGKSEEGKMEKRTKICKDSLSEREVWGGGIACWNFLESVF